MSRRVVFGDVPVELRLIFPAVVVDIHVKCDHRASEACCQCANADGKERIGPGSLSVDEEHVSGVRELAIRTSHADRNDEERNDEERNDEERSDEQ